MTDLREILEIKSVLPSLDEERVARIAPLLDQAPQYPDVLALRESLRPRLRARGAVRALTPERTVLVPIRSLLEDVVGLDVATTLDARATRAGGVALMRAVMRAVPEDEAARLRALAADRMMNDTDAIIRVGRPLWALAAEILRGERAGAPAGWPEHRDLHPIVTRAYEVAEVVVACISGIETGEGALAQSDVRRAVIAAVREAERRVRGAGEALVSIVAAHAEDPVGAVRLLDDLPQPLRARMRGEVVEVCLRQTAADVGRTVRAGAAPAEVAGRLGDVVARLQWLERNQLPEHARLVSGIRTDAAAAAVAAADRLLHTPIADPARCSDREAEAAAHALAQLKGVARPLGCEPEMAARIDDAVRTVSVPPARPVAEDDPGFAEVVRRVRLLELLAGSGEAVGFYRRAVARTAPRGG